MRLNNLLSVAVAAGLIVCTGTSGLAQRRVAESVPDVLPLLPLTDGVMFPGVSNEVQIIAPQHKRLIEDVANGDSLLGLVTLMPGALPNDAGNGPIFPAGIVCVVDEVKRGAEGFLYVKLRAVMRFRVAGEEGGRPYRMGRLDLRPEPLGPDEATTLRGLRERIDELTRIVDPIVLPPKSDDGRINALAFYLDLDLFERQSLLDQDGILARARAMIALLEVKAANLPARTQ